VYSGLYSRPVYEIHGRKLLSVQKMAVAVLERSLQVTVRPVLWDRCHVCPVCNVDVLWPNGWMDQDATWCKMEVVL